MRTVCALVVICLVALAGCGSDDGSDSGTSSAPPPQQQDAPATTTKPTEPRGTEIVLGDSEFGSMLFGSDKQAIYIFENDPEGESVCVDECAEAWPPVFTDGEPRAGKGVKKSLLGTVKRPDGKQQVTYAGKPLYFYAHEGPGEVRCHNVNLNGGLWWVVGADGKRRP